jgi:hypothetical protein
MIMEFEELQLIWDSQNNKPLYVIDERALHNRILSKKKQARRITNISELLSIIANTCTGCFILGANLFKQSGNISMYLLSAWMFATALFTLVGRIRRQKRDHRFDRSMLGDLRYAISVATYQVRLSQLLRWNMLPIGILIILGVWENGKSVWLAVGISIFLFLANYAAGWEHGIYKKKKRELEMLRNKLENEDPDDLR